MEELDFLNEANYNQASEHLEYLEYAKNKNKQNNKELDELVFSTSDNVKFSQLVEKYERKFCTNFYKNALLITYGKIKKLDICNSYKIILNKYKQIENKVYLNELPGYQRFIFEFMKLLQTHESKLNFCEKPEYFKYNNELVIEKLDYKDENSLNKVMKKVKVKPFRSNIKQIVFKILNKVNTENKYKIPLIIVETIIRNSRAPIKLHQLNYNEIKRLFKIRIDKRFEKCSFFDLYKKEILKITSDIKNILVELNKNKIYTEKKSSSDHQHEEDKNYQKRKREIKNTKNKKVKY